MLLSLETMCLCASNKNQRTFTLDLTDRMGHVMLVLTAQEKKTTTIKWPGRAAMDKNRRQERERPWRELSPPPACTAVATCYWKITQQARRAPEWFIISVSVDTCLCIVKFHCLKLKFLFLVLFPSRCRVVKKKTQSWFPLNQPPFCCYSDQ